MEDLLIHKDEINMQMARYGVNFGLYKNGKFKERLFPYGPIPRVISGADFSFVVNSSQGGGYKNTWITSP